MKPPAQTQHLEAILVLLLVNLFWGLSFPMIKALTLLQAQLFPTAGTWFSTLYLVTPRFLLATMILIVLQPCRCWRITHAEIQQGLLIGLFSAIGMLLQNDGLQFTSASTSAFLTQFYAILIPVVLAVRYRRNPGNAVWLSCLLVLAGAAILGRFDWQQLRFGRGEAETLLSSLFFMGQILTLGWRRYASNRPQQITLVMFATQALLFSVLTVGAAPNGTALIRPWTSPVWLGFTLVLTVVCTIGSFSLMNAWQPKISSTEAGLIYCAEPIFGSILALFLPAWFSLWTGLYYPNETATWTLLVGGTLIIMANVLVQLRPPRFPSISTDPGASD